MDEAFVIMQIGDAQMDAVYDDVFAPAIESNELAPRRVDRHNSGELLKSEIVRFIKRATVIVADLTNARPNCYLEVGYAMGAGRINDLILTAREDHHHSSERFDAGGSRIHFDLEGYDILFWHEDRLKEFREELSKVIDRRKRLANTRVDVAIGSSSLSVSAASPPGDVHDATLALVQSGDRIGLTEMLRRERATFESAVFEVESKYERPDQPNPTDENILKAWDQVLPAAERRLASLMPLCLYDLPAFSVEVGSLARMLERKSPQDGLVVWQEIGAFAVAWIAYVCGALAVATENIESTAPLLNERWKNRFGGLDSLAWLPGSFSSDLGSAKAEKNWISPIWEFLTGSLSELGWVLDRHGELFQAGEPRGSMSIFDTFVCLQRGSQGERSMSFGSLGRSVPPYIERLAADRRIRVRVADAIGVSVEDFDTNAGEWFAASQKFHGGFDDFGDIKAALSKLSPVTNENKPWHA